MNQPARAALASGAGHLPSTRPAKARSTTPTRTPRSPPWPMTRTSCSNCFCATAASPRPRPVRQLERPQVGSLPGHLHLRQAGRLMRILFILHSHPACRPAAPRSSPATCSAPCANRGVEGLFLAGTAAPAAPAQPRHPVPDRPRRAGRGPGLDRRLRPLLHVADRPARPRTAARQAPGRAAAGPRPHPSPDADRRRTGRLDPALRASRSHRHDAARLLRHLRQ